MYSPVARRSDACPTKIIVLEAFVFNRAIESPRVAVQAQRHRRQTDDLSPTMIYKSPELLRVLRIPINDR